MAYAGYQGYDPELDRLKQRRDIAEALQQGALETGPKSLPEGIAQIGKALIARQAMKKANKAGDAYKSNQDRIADLFVSQMFPGDAAAQAYPELPMQPNTDASNVPGPSQALPASTTQGALGALMPKAPQPAAAPSVAPAQPQVGANQTSQAMPNAPTPRGAMTPWSIPDPGMSALGQATPPAGAMPPQGSAAPMAGRGGFTPQQQQAGADASQVRAMIAMGMNPMEAASTVKGEQRQRQADALAERERNRPIVINDQLVDPNTYQRLPGADFRDAPETKPSIYNEVTLSDGVYSVNQNDPTDKIRIGDAPKKPGEGPLDPNDPERIRLEREFSKDWKTVQNDYDGIDRQYNNISAMVRQARSDPKAASAADLALVVGFTKLQDPGTVAMPGEVQLTQQTVGVVQYASNLLNTWENGKTVLPDDVRKNILAASTELHRVYQDAYQKRGSEYATTAQSYGFDPKRTLIGYQPQAPEQPKPNLFDTASQFFGNMLTGGGQRPSPMRPGAQQQRNALPPGVTPEMWSVMDDEDKAAFQQ